MDYSFIREYRSIKGYEDALAEDNVKLILDKNIHARNDPSLNDEGNGELFTAKFCLKGKEDNEESHRCKNG